MLQQVFGGGDSDRHPEVPCDSNSRSLEVTQEFGRNTERCGAQERRGLERLETHHDPRDTDNRFFGDKSPPEYSGEMFDDHTSQDFPTNSYSFAKTREYEWISESAFSGGPNISTHQDRSECGDSSHNKRRENQTSEDLKDTNNYNNSERERNQCYSEKNIQARREISKSSKRHTEEKRQESPGTGYDLHTSSCSRPRSRSGSQSRDRWKSRSPESDWRSTHSSHSSGQSRARSPSPRSVSDRYTDKDYENNYTIDYGREIGHSCGKPDCEKGKQETLGLEKNQKKASGGPHEEDNLTKTIRKQTKSNEKIRTAKNKKKESHERITIQKNQEEMISLTSFRDNKLQHRKHSDSVDSNKSFWPSRKQKTRASKSPADRSRSGSRGESSSVDRSRSWSPSLSKAVSHGRSRARSRSLQCIASRSRSRERPVLPKATYTGRIVATNSCTCSRVIFSSILNLSQQHI